MVGAGAAGLSAAWELAAADCAVTVFESRGEAGGRMRTTELDGIRFDAGVQLLASNYTSTLALARAAGAGGLVRRSPGRDGVWRKGRANALTYGSVASMLTSGALPASLKLRLGTRYLPYLARHAARLDLHDLLNTGGLEHDGESIAEWGERELGSDFVELLAYPLLGAYYGSEPENVAAAVYHALARVGLDVSVHAVEGGMAQVPQLVAGALQARGVDIAYHTAVEALEEQPNGVTLEHSTACAFDAAIVATPAPQASRLLKAHDELVTWLHGVRTVPTVTLALLLSRPARADFFGLSIPRDQTELSAAVALCVQERKVPGLVPEDRGAIVVLPAPGLSFELSRQTPEGVFHRLLPSAERVFTGLGETVMRARTTAFEEGYTVFYAGYLHHLDALKKVAVPKRIALAGDYLVAPTVEGAVRSGAAAARRILTLLRAAR